VKSVPEKLAADLRGLKGSEKAKSNPQEGELPDWFLQILLTS
jgi:hypothetical protein